MKISISFEEIESLKSLIQTSEEVSREITHAVGEPYISANMSGIKVIAEINKTRFAKASISLTGVTIVIEPEFISDFLEVYGDCIRNVGSTVVCLIRTFNILNSQVELLTNKWVGEVRCANA